MKAVVVCSYANLPFPLLLTLIINLSVVSPVRQSTDSVQIVTRISQYVDTQENAP